VYGKIESLEAVRLESFRAGSIGRRWNSTAFVRCPSVLSMRYIAIKYIEAVSKPSIGFKVKANCEGQPQEYQGYFEDWTSQFNTEIETEGRF
jgi:hypothetical protein